MTQDQVPAPYEVRWTENSLSQLQCLEKGIAQRIVRKIEEVKRNPFRFVEKLHGFDLFRLRVGDYRVIMGIDEGKMVIFVLELGHRSIIYRKY